MWLQRADAHQRIDDLVQHIGLSQSALERRFRRIVGVTPKRFASIVRLRRAVILRTAGADLTTVAHETGYFDQSHFIHAFRRAIGSPPEAFFFAGIHSSSDADFLQFAEPRRHYRWDMRLTDERSASASATSFLRVVWAACAAFAPVAAVATFAVEAVPHAPGIGFIRLQASLR